MLKKIILSSIIILNINGMNAESFSQSQSYLETLREYIDNPTLNKYNSLDNEKKLKIKKEILEKITYFEEKIKNNESLEINYLLAELNRYANNLKINNSDIYYKNSIKNASKCIKYDSCKLSVAKIMTTKNSVKLSNPINILKSINWKESNDLLLKKDTLYYLALLYFSSDELLESFSVFQNLLKLNDYDSGTVSLFFDLETKMALRDKKDESIKNQLLETTREYRVINSEVILDDISKNNRFIDDEIFFISLIKDYFNNLEEISPNDINRFKNYKQKVLAIKALSISKNFNKNVINQAISDMPFMISEYVKENLKYWNKSENLNKNKINTEVDMLIYAKKLNEKSTNIDDIYNNRVIDMNLNMKLDNIKDNKEFDILLLKEKIKNNLKD